MKSNAALPALLLMFSLAGCTASTGYEDKDEAYVAKKKDPGGARVEEPLAGKIGADAWKFARGLAYVNPEEPTQIVIGLFSAAGPTGCSIEGGSVSHRYADETSVDTDDVTVRVPSRLVSLPWKSKAAEVAIGDVSSSGEGATMPATSAAVEISELTRERIVGTVSAEAATGDVAGAFVAEFCDEY